MSLALVRTGHPHRPCGYRQRDAFLSPLWRILTDHLETFLQIYDSRFESTYGSLKPYAERAFQNVVLCGDPNLGVTRFCCSKCDIEMGVPFSCKSRICPSCVKRRAAVLAANLVELLPEVGHRHIVFTIPRKAGLRLRILEDPKLFRKIAQIITRVLRRQMVKQLSIHRNLKKELKDKLLPGILMCQHSFASDLSFHPHWHVIVSDGAWSPDGDHFTLWNWDVEGPLEDFRSSVLRAFVKWAKLSPETAAKLQGWESEISGFSCFVQQPIPGNDKDGLARLIRYIFRAPCSYRQLSYDETTGMVRCSSKRGGFKQWHATEFLAVLSQHVPKPRQHTVTYSGYYANAAGNLKKKEEDEEKPQEAEAPKMSGFKLYTWRELIHRVYNVDPLACPKCGLEMKRRRTMRGEELKEFLSAINKLGYPPRPPPTPPPELDDAHQVDVPNACPPSQNFPDQINQVPPGWDT